MKTAYIPIVVFLLFAGCMHDFKNPSDPKADDFVTHSHAVLSIISGTAIYAGDTVRISGGISSKPVEQSGLVTEMRWDFNGDGQTDTVVYQSDTMSLVYPDTGVFRCAIVCTDRAGFSDSANATIHVRPAKPPTKTLTIVVNNKDTVHVTIANIPVVVVSPSGDSIKVVPRTGDSISVITNKTDTSAYVVKPAGTISVSTIPTDTISVPPIGIYIPDFPNITDFPNIVKGECPFYTTDSSLMHATLNFYDIMWEQTKSDGLAAITFAEKLVADIMGYSIITLIDGNYSYTYGGGVYQFKSSQGFTLSCAFHYGAGVSGHAEDDTVKANLFSLDSYVSGLKASLSAPYYSYTKGPLFDLIDGTPSIDASLHVSFSINFTKLKISFLRSSVLGPVALPFFVVNDSITLPVTHTSISRMNPTPMRSFGDLFHNDSIVIDHAGTSMSSAPTPLWVTYRSGSVYKKTKYSFSIQQKMDAQKTAYGDRNGALKFSGQYAAQAALGFNNNLDSIFFKGNYSSTMPDSSWFFCDPKMAVDFGTLFFSVTPADVGIFSSKKYGYSFPYRPLQTTLESYLIQ